MNRARIVPKTELILVRRKQPGCAIGCFPGDRHFHSILHKFAVSVQRSAPLRTTQPDRRPRRSRIQSERLRRRRCHQLNEIHDGCGQVSLKISVFAQETRYIFRINDCYTFAQNIGTDRFILRPLNRANFLVMRQSSQRAAFCNLERSFHRAHVSEIGLVATGFVIAGFQNASVGK